MKLKNIVVSAVIGVLVAAGAAIGASSGTNRLQAVLIELFCEACGPVRGQDVRDLVSSVVTLGDTQTITGTKTFSAAPALSALSATGAVCTDASKNLTSTCSGVSPTYTTVNATNLIATNVVQGPAGVFNTASNNSGMADDGTGTHGISFRVNTVDGVGLMLSTGFKYSTGTTANQMRMAQTTAPTCANAACGTSATVAGTDTSGIVTMGATGTPASGWVLTFNGTWAANPACIVLSAKSGMVAGKAPIVVSPTTTTLTVTTNGTAPANSDQYSYVCIGVS